MKKDFIVKLKTKFQNLNPYLGHSVTDLNLVKSVMPSCSPQTLLVPLFFLTPPNHGMRGSPNVNVYTKEAVLIKIAVQAGFI